MRPGNFRPLMALVNILLTVGILLFAKGFFPYKPFLPGLAIFDKNSTFPPAHFDKVIFMVVDALRSDFVFTERSGFRNTQSLITTGNAVPFTAHATSPTITMPRVKAITTGSIPSFLDVILNFAESDTSSTLANQDNWLAQIRQRGGNLVMYGDDTWLKLFPGMFKRSEGTTSFYVSDFTEVDNNVTRHIDGELANNDWNGMIMHYLGLDHIGHKAGPQSVFMLPKQEEMDEIVEKIFAAICTKEHLQSTLFILAGDHGMNDAGNHGGSAPGETSPALVFISPKFRRISPPTGRESPATAKKEFQFYTTVEQSDIVPSLAGLLGLPIPRNNLGVFIPSLLEMWPNVDDRVEIMLRNSRQLLEIVKAAYPDFHKQKELSDCEDAGNDIEELACMWNKTVKSSELWKQKIVDSAAMIALLYEFSTHCQELLAKVASNYDLKLMGIAMGFLLVASCLSLKTLIPLWRNSILADLVFPALILAYGGMMFASSYVEEEHNFWYWTASAWVFALLIKERRNGTRGIYAFLILGLLRVTRRWNQSGQKSAGAPDIARGYLPENTTLLWCMIIATYGELFQRLGKRAFQRAGHVVAFVFSFTTIMAAFAFKVSFAAQDAVELIPEWIMPLAEALNGISLVTHARIVFMAIFVGVIYTAFFELGSRASYHDLNAAFVFNDFFNLFLITQARVVNVPLFLFFQLIADFFGSMGSASSSEITISTLILQHFSFFAFAGTNAISSVDLSNAYNGVSGYNLTIVGILTFVSNWIGPIYWSTMGVVLLARKQFQDKFAYKRHVVMLSTFNVVAAFVVMVACTTLRNHLFIWTVFSPKFLYSMVWGIPYHIVVNLGIGGFMHWASKRRVG
ncbi:major facilitator superfamily transporter protein [Rhizina undulata]